jgi:hypothetical protein
MYRANKHLDLKEPIQAHKLFEKIDRIYHSIKDYVSDEEREHLIKDYTHILYRLRKSR